jgi:hypothetical protein
MASCLPATLETAVLSAIAADLARPPDDAGLAEGSRWGRRVRRPQWEVDAELAIIVQEALSQLPSIDNDPRIDRRGGPRLLLLAVLKNAVDAVEEWCRRHATFGERTHDRDRLRAKTKLAYDYLMCDDCELVTSFLGICGELDIDPDVARARILKRMDPAAIEQLLD